MGRFFSSKIQRMWRLCTWASVHCIKTREREAQSDNSSGIVTTNDPNDQHSLAKSPHKNKTNQSSFHRVLAMYSCICWVTSTQNTLCCQMEFSIRTLISLKQSANASTKQTFCQLMQLFWVIMLVELKWQWNKTDLIYYHDRSITARVKLFWLALARADTVRIHAQVQEAGCSLQLVLPPALTRLWMLHIQALSNSNFNLMDKRWTNTQAFKGILLRKNLVCI